MNRRRRFVTLVPYIICSLFVVVTTEFIIFGQQYQQHQGGHPPITLSDIIGGGWSGGERRIKHVSTLEEQSRNHVIDFSTTTSTSVSGRVGRTENVIINTTTTKRWIRNNHISTSATTSTPASPSATFLTTTATKVEEGTAVRVTKNKIILAISPMTRSKTVETPDDEHHQNTQWHHHIGERRNRSASKRTFISIVMSRRNVDTSNSGGAIMNGNNSSITVTNNNNNKNYLIRGVNYNADNVDNRVKVNIKNIQATSDAPHRFKNDAGQNSVNTNHDAAALSQTRISCFVVYQLWILVRIVLMVLVARYLHFLQIIRSTKKGGHHPQPKRSNATRRGVINITINDVEDL